MANRWGNNGNSDRLYFLRLQNHFIFFFLVLPVYCYQPISLHPHAHMLSHVTPWTAARQAPLFMGFSRQEYWSGLPFPSPSNSLQMVTAAMKLKDDCSLEEKP
ncbi:unnamed protein product [Rangifer tarandus platyrhynchus]|uniref:Uncharacterized protein n=2 Tax=Rangifer tarandus platyrhynchus TaxID=3082113 RepID=A0AC60AA18_RANTA|nr:unnamed protein product [Rangifer tarandus platyrhynchus]